VFKYNKYLFLKFEVKIVKMKHLLVRYLRYLLIIHIFIAVSMGCDEIDSQVPDVPFAFTINLNIQNELTVPGNSMYYPGPGFGGVIVYCELPGSYYAYDATCTHEISQNCKLVNEGVLGTCSCCGSKFTFIGTAYPSDGPASAPLKQYHVSVINSTLLRVYN
jgi:Rieske Fe-S protein